MTLEHMLNHGVHLSEDVRVAGALAEAIGLQTAWTRCDVLLAQSGEVPDTHSLIERCRNDEIVGRMELGGHHVVVVAGQNGDTGARLPVPDSDGLVIGCADDPRVLVVEVGGSNVVQMTEQREDAALQLVVPHLDLVVVAAGHEERLLFVEVDASHRTLVLVELLDQRTDAVVPQLNETAVQADQNPGPLRVEGEALHTGGFGLKFVPHCGGLFALIFSVG